VVISKGAVSLFLPKDEKLIRKITTIAFRGLLF
jgi:hypothetical protein